MIEFVERVEPKDSYSCCVCGKGAVISLDFDQFSTNKVILCDDCLNSLHREITGYIVADAASRHGFNIKPGGEVMPTICKKILILCGVLELLLVVVVAGYMLLNPGSPHMVEWCCTAITSLILGPFFILAATRPI